jgi:hypothetical protein
VEEGIDQLVGGVRKRPKKEKAKERKREKSVTDINNDGGQGKG